MSKEKELVAKYKHLSYLYFHKSEKQEEYNALLKELRLTDDQVTSAIERCKGDDHFRGASKASILLTDFFDKASEDEKGKFSLFALLLLLCNND